MAKDVCIKHLRNASSSKPQPSNLEHGELAVGYFKDNETLFLKNSADVVTRIPGEKIVDDKIDSAKTEIHNEVTGLTENMTKNYKMNTEIIKHDGNKALTILPNKLYVVTNASNLTVTLGGSSEELGDNYVDEYMLELKSSTKVNFSGITWARPFPSTLLKQCSYHISIVNKLGLWCEF